MTYTKFLLDGSGKIQKHPDRVVAQFDSPSGSFSPQACAACDHCWRLTWVKATKGHIYVVKDDNTLDATSPNLDWSFTWSHSSSCSNNDVISDVDGRTQVGWVATGGWTVYYEDAFIIVAYQAVKTTSDVRCGYQSYWADLHLDYYYVAQFFPGSPSALASFMTAHGAATTHVTSSPTAGLYPPDSFLLETVMITPPPSVVTAGIPFTVEISTLNPTGTSWNALTILGVSHDCSIESNPTQIDTLGGTTSVFQVPGTVVTFSPVLHKVCTGLVLALGAAASEFDRWILTDPIQVVAGAATKLVITSGHFDDHFVNEPFTIKVEIRDAYDNLVNSTAAVALAGPHLNGTLTASAVAGVATFSVSVDQAAFASNIAASSSGLTGANYNQIVIAQLAWIAAPSDAVNNVPFSPNIAVKVVDFLGATITGATDTLNLHIFGGAGVHLQGDLGPTVPTAGVVTFGPTWIDAAGTYNIFARGSGATYPVVNPGLGQTVVIS